MEVLFSALGSLLVVSATLALCFVVRNYARGRGGFTKSNKI